MELGSLEVQIFVSLVVVLGTAFIALVCDFLKGNNEQLRERNVELRTRQDERDRLGLGQPLHWLQGLASLITNKHTTAAPSPRPENAPEAPFTASAAATPTVPQAAAMAQAGFAAPTASLSVDLPAPTPQVPEPVSTLAEAPMRLRAYDELRQPGGGASATWASKEELEQLAGRAARIRARHEAAKTGQEEAIEKLIQDLKTNPGAPAPSAVPSAAALSPVSASSVKVRILPIKPAFEPATAEELSAPPAPAEIERPPEPVAELEPITSAVSEPPSQVEIEPALPTSSLEGSSWGQAMPAALAAEPPLIRAEEVVAETALAAQPPGIFEEAAPAVAVAQPSIEQEKFKANRPALPAGLHTAPTLLQLLEANQPFTGVVVSIGINDFDAHRERLGSEAGREAQASVNRLLESMMRPIDFASPFQEDDFVLLFPDEVGPQAQRRLFQVSEKLWDHQLRSLGQASVMFSWGGVEALDEPLSSAVASARERMHQTRRNRRSPADQRRVANG